MPFTVFHYNGDDRFRRFDESAFADGLTPDFAQVAEVEASNLDEVYALTQHLARPWTDGPRVTLNPSDREALALARAANPDVNSSMLLRIRSTSVGDVIVDPEGVAHGVSPVGFTRLS